MIAVLMTDMRRRFTARGLLTRFAIAACLSVYPLLGISLRADIIEQILVKVNGDIFTKTDLENAQVQTLRQRGQQ